MPCPAEEVAIPIIKPQEDEKPHIAMFPWLSFGHINPFIQLSHKLAHYGFRISFLATRDSIPNIKPFFQFPEKICLVPLDVVLASSPQSAQRDTPVGGLTRILMATDSLQDQVESELILLKPDIIVYEFANYFPAIANRLGIKPVFYSCTSAANIAYDFVPSSTVAAKEDEFAHPPVGYHPKTLFLQPYEERQLLFALKRHGGELSLYERVVTAIKGADLILMKTCKEMEQKYCEFIEKQYGTRVVLTGPSLPEPQADPLDGKWDSWLAKFPDGSVLYCSFGSEDVLQKEQLTELLLGLEGSCVPFMAVLKFPGGETQEEILPEGFLERVKERGLIHSGWVQQQQILAHKAVGGYLSHSGYGSLLEAMSSGCQLVLLPQKGDQFVNARLMSMELKVGVEIKRCAEDGKFSKEDVCKAVRSVMVDVDDDVGREVRGNHAKLKDVLLNQELQLGYLEQVVHELGQLGIIRNNSVSK